MTLFEHTFAIVLSKDLPTGVDIKKRDAIIHATIEAVAENGYHNMDVKSIANRANVGNGTVYRYFISKEHLFQCVALWVVSEISHRASSILKQDCDCRTKILKIVEAQVSYFADHPKTIELFVWQRALFRQGYSQELNTHLKKLSYDPLNSAIQEGIEKEGLEIENVGKIIYTISSLVAGLVTRSIETTGLVEHVKYVCEPILEKMLTNH